MTMARQRGNANDSNDNDNDNDHESDGDDDDEKMMTITTMKMVLASACGHFFFLCRGRLKEIFPNKVSQRRFRDVMLPFLIIIFLLRTCEQHAATDLENCVHAKPINC